MMNLFKPIRLAALFLVFAFHFIGCKPSDGEIFRAQGEALDFCVFEEGSVWIYEETISGEIDTVRLISTRTSFIDGDDDPDKFEIIGMMFSHSARRPFSISI